MTTQGASEFLDQLIADPALRSQFRSDPQGTMIAAGLDEEARSALGETDWSEVSDERLAQRVSKIRGNF